MADVDEEIREIKREIIESRGLVIKTSNLTNSLAADIKSIAKRQAGYERRFNWNSWIAYILFAALSFAGLYLATSARISEVQAATAQLERRADELQRELEEERQRAERRARAEVQASQFYWLIREGRRSDARRAEAVEQYAQVQREELSPAEAAFFRDAVDQFEVDLSNQAYHDGLEMVRTGRYAEAAEQFQEAIRLNEGGAHIPAVRLALARALYRVGRYAQAKEIAGQVANQQISPELQDDGWLLVADSAEALGQINDAIRALRAYMQRSERGERGEYIVEVRRRLAELNRRVMRGETGPRP